MGGPDGGAGAAGAGTRWRDGAVHVNRRWVAECCGRMDPPHPPAWLRPTSLINVCPLNPSYPGMAARVAVGDRTLEVGGKQWAAPTLELEVWWVGGGGACTCRGHGH